MQNFKIDFLSVYAAQMGHIANACRNCNISRQTYYDWMKNDSEFKKAIEDLEESFIDDSECVLKKLIKAEDLKATQYHLDAKARSRGYGAKLEIQHGGAVGQPKLEVAPALAAEFTETWLKREKEKLEASQTPGTAAEVSAPAPQTEQKTNESSNNK